MKFVKSYSAIILLTLIFVLALAGFPVATRAQLRPITVAPGFEVQLFADQMNVEEFAKSFFSGPTSIAFDKRGRLFVGTYSGKILILLDNDEDGRCDEVKTFAENIPLALGMTFHPNGDLYTTSNILGGEGRILRLRDTNGDDIADETTVIITGLPSHGDHQTNRPRFGPDGLLYFGQGSATDNGIPKSGRPADLPLNATILRMNVNDPNSLAVFARGLRNPFGIAFHPENGELFSTDGGSGEVCQVLPCPADDPAPPEEVNWVVEGGHYGFSACEGTPTEARPGCAGVRAPAIQYSPHLTPTSLAFYTGPQAGEFKNHLLLTLFKNLPDSQNHGGDLRRMILEGDRQTGFRLRDDGFIAQFNPIDPFDGPVDTAIDPISGDIYVVRFDPVSHRNSSEHHHIIYRIHREGSDLSPFIGNLRPASIVEGSVATTLNLTVRHVKPGAAVFAGGQMLATRPGATDFELLADLPATMLTSAKTITLEVRNLDGKVSNPLTFTVLKKEDQLPSPTISSLLVYKKKRRNIINPVLAGTNAKKVFLAVSGINIDAGAQLLVNGQPLVIVSSDANEIVGRLTNELLATPSQLTVQVRNATGKLSNLLTLNVVMP